jgi:hypothetical protein
MPSLSEPQPARSTRPQFSPGADIVSKQDRMQANDHLAESLLAHHSLDLHRSNKPNAALLTHCLRLFTRASASKGRSWTGVLVTGRTATRRQHATAGRTKRETSRGRARLLSFRLDQAEDGSRSQPKAARRATLEKPPLGPADFRSTGSLAAKLRAP